jgi:ABC-type glycerol-3-phosphate transport system substrate-binding protein
MSGTGRRPLAVAGMVAVGLSLAACSGNSSQGAAPPTTPTTVKVTTSPATAPSQASIRKDVQLFNCAAAKNGWSAGGTVESSLNHPATYDITVFFTSSAPENLDYGSTSVPLKPGQVKLWSVNAIFAAPSTVLCVLTSVSTS